jgi:hypothetical protein
LTTGKAVRRGLATAMAFLVGVGLTASAWAQNFFYREIAKDGRIYVFAIAKEAEAFEKSGEMGKSLTRLGYGPNGETMIFDSEDAIGLYNLKHDRPGDPTAIKAPEPPKSPFPAGKFSGLMFGDYYFYDKWHQDQISATNTNGFQGQQGFWMRRAYFTYDLAFNEKFTTRFRLEANSNGQLAGGNLNPFVKDAYVKWTYHGKQQLTLGISPSLTFDWLEGYWGLRHIEKTPADLYRIDSSRDFALTFTGPVGSIGGLSYGAQFGNDSGNGSEQDKYKILRFEGRYEKSPGIAIEGFYSFGKRPNGQDRTTAQGFAGYKNNSVRVGGQYLWQKRESGKDAVPNQTIDIWSGFLVWDIKPKKYDLFARVDGVKGELGSVETGLPGADGIDYWVMSPKSKFTAYIAGGEVYLHPSIRFSPNLELVKYSKDPDATAFPGRDQDRLFRLTFYWTF